MPSRADGTRTAGVRVWLERLAQAVAVAIVVWLLVDVLRPRAAAPTEIVRVRDLPATLRRWSTVAAPHRAHVRLDSALAPTSRDWLAAIAAAGAPLTWDGDAVLPLAAVADPIADPVGGTRVWVAAPSGTPVVFEDAFGMLDSARAGAAGGARLLARSEVDLPRARAGALVASTATRDSLSFARVLVLGRVGWEGKFVAAALEERGWKVDARLMLSPKGHVVQGRQTPIDTGRYSAVVVLDDEALAGLPDLGRYVRDGGGVVIASAAAAAPAVASLRAGALRPAIAAVEPFDSAAVEPRRALGLLPIALRPDAIAIEQRDAHVAVAARRIGRGRVATVGYEDTWRWRMGGNSAALEEHRAWWAGLVASVAHVGRTPRVTLATLDEAPLVGLLDRLGLPSEAPAAVAPRRRIPDAWLLAVFSIALLGAWLSRRLRGAP